ncbi:hypothetical protein Taro_015375 [Colocasia esculenta]|uniref:Uncharacterized protein n=1 Tax=Colocasia esculenta TaxID=4460 RepID=A0A843UM54_COLES|nr:hypothetical protein [Colocasia esculenta]
MSFSLTILSLLARLRVLVQQMLVDIVSVFNTVSSLSQKKHSVKLIKNGVEAFREYYPPNGQVVSLDCSWEGDKFVLVERTCISKTKELEEDVGVASLEASGVQYEKIEASEEDPGGANASDCNDEEHVLKEGAFALPPCKVDSPTTGVPSSSSQRLYDSSKTRKIAAFIPVKVIDETGQMASKKIKLDEPLSSNPLDTKESEDSFFNLLTAGSMKSSLFD